LVKAAKIPYRVGTSHRLFHLWTCNLRPNFTRKNSDFHESQLNFELFRNFGLTELPSLHDLVRYIGDFKPQVKLSSFLKAQLIEGKRVVLHAKSQGSAVEWPIKNYIDLAQKLVNNNYIVYFSGTENEGKQFRKYLPVHPHIIDLSGKSSLAELIAFINCCDALVACSTGPLHLASVLGKKAIGLYTDMRPMHPGRWAPIGRNSTVLTAKNSETPQREDILRISVEEVFNCIKTS